MTRIGDLLARDHAMPVEEFTRIDNADPDIVFADLSEYVATDRIRAEYERLFAAIAESRGEGVAVWISGLTGSGRSSFARNLGFVLANREVRGVPASALFLKSERLELLQGAVPRQVFMFNVQAELAAQPASEQLADLIYGVLLRELNYAEDRDLAELEIELETEHRLSEFEELCRAEYGQDWRTVRRGSQRIARASALLHRLDSRTYASAESALNTIRQRPSTRPPAQRLVERWFDICETRCPGRSFALIMDDIDAYVASDRARLAELCSIIERFSQEGLRRLKSGRIAGPVWIVATARGSLQEICEDVIGSRADLRRLRGLFQHSVLLSSQDVAEVVGRRVLSKTENGERDLRALFRDCGASLIQNVRLEGYPRGTAFGEDEFVRFYPYLPHVMELSIDILEGLRSHPSAPVHAGGGNRTIMRQCFEMLFGDRTRLADQPAGTLVSMDCIYGLLARDLSWEKQKAILDISQRFDDEDYPGMAVRIARALSLMELVPSGPPRTAKNIAALLIQRVTDPPLVTAVSTVLYRLKSAGYVRESEGGWKLNELDQLRTAAAGLERLRRMVGVVNPRPPGWRHVPIQAGKRLLARSLAWYTRPLNEFNASVAQSLEGIVSALDHLFRDMVVFDRLTSDMNSVEQLSMNQLALEGRLERSEQQLARLHQLAGATEPAGQEPRPAETWRPATRTAYLIGLFGTGRRYIDELILNNIGPRAKYFRDGIRLHPGPTPMIYSGHATIRHVSGAHEMPAIMHSILDAVHSGFADLIFVYRHPLDSLLTNWIWWRTYLRESRAISGISQLYTSTDDLCRDLEANFAEFVAFSRGGCDLSSRFLSFDQFVEETELQRQAASIALRLEDFGTDPLGQFSRITEVMSVDCSPDPARIVPPGTRPYRYLAVREGVPQFRDFMEGLDPAVRKSIGRLGYSL